MLAKAPDPRSDIKGHTSLVTYKLLCCACVKAGVNFISQVHIHTKKHVICSLNCVQFVKISGRSEVLVKSSGSDSKTHSHMPNLLLMSPANAYITHFLHSNAI